MKWAGCKYCSHAHAMAARPPAQVVEPGARARYSQGRARAEAELRALLGELIGEDGRIPLDEAVAVAMVVVERRYERGYLAGRAKLRADTRTLRLMASQDALERFVGSRVGKAFVMGTLSPDALAKFSFGGRR